MKKLFLIGFAVSALALNSCTTDGHTETTSTISAPTITLITNTLDNSVSVNPGYYNFTITSNNDGNTCVINSPQLIANNTSLAFSSDAKSFSMAENDILVTNINATAGSTGLQINNSSFLAVYPLTQFSKYGYYFDTTYLGPKYTFSVSNLQPWITLAAYNIGDTYRVRTFPINSFFKGNTVTTYPQSPDPYTTDGITYRIIVKNNGNGSDGKPVTYSADAIMYNAKFSSNDREPLKTAILIPDLDIEFNPNGITITGNNIIPSVYEAGDFTENPAFIINEFNFETSNSNYTDARIYFKVAGIYEGNFDGTYLNSYFLQ